MNIKNQLLPFLFLFSFSAIAFGKTMSSAEEDNPLENMTVLVYTKNGEGYVHDNIPYAVEAIKKLGEKHGFKVDVSENPRDFTDSNLQQYNMLIFTSTNNDVFDNDEQRLAFRRYIEAGGGFVGIHSVVGTERNWEWFKNMVGGSFVWHPRFQKYQIKTIDTSHPSVKDFHQVWEKEDECYFVKELYPGIKVIMAHDLETLDQDQAEKINESKVPFTKLYPAVWHQNFDGGHIWISALGHHIKDYEDPDFVQHMYLGILYIADQIGVLDYSKAYATSKDEAVQYY